MDRSLVPQVFALVLLLMDVMHFNNYGLDCCYKFVVIHFTVTPSLNSSNDGNELLVSCIETVQVHEAIKIEMRDLTLILAINLSEGCLGVPSRASMEALLQHFKFQVAVDFGLEVVGHGFGNRRVEPLALLEIDIVSFPLTNLLSELLLVARKNELEELLV